MTTHKGKVVYARPKHTFDLRDVRRIVRSIVDSEDFFDEVDEPEAALRELMALASLMPELMSIQARLLLNLSDQLPGIVPEVLTVMLIPAKKILAIYSKVRTFLYKTVQEVLGG